VAFTFAPQTPFLAIALPLGKLFPRSDRSPAIEPVRPAQIGRRLTEAGLKLGRTHRVSRGFYTSQALEVLRAVCREESRLLPDPLPWAGVTELGSSSITVTLRAWTRLPIYWDVRFDLLRAVKLGMDRAGIRHGFPVQITA
jgi:hypothetical protein